jgi:hypothetical protein
LPPATRDTLWFARSALTGTFLAQKEPRHCRPEDPSHPHCSPSILEFALEVSNLPMPLFRQVSPQSPCNCSPELFVPPRDFFHYRLRSLAPPCRFYAHGCVRRVALNVPDPFPKPLKPCRSRPPRLRRALTTRPSAALMSAPGSWIPGVYPRSNGLGLINVDLILALRSRSDRSSLSPSPVPLPLGPAGQPALVR